MTVGCENYNFQIGKLMVNIQFSFKINMKTGTFQRIVSNENTTFHLKKSERKFSPPIPMVKAQIFTSKGCEN